ncbi:TlpA disulfide reductase family protein [soil metagenome]
MKTRSSVNPRAPLSRRLVAAAFAVAFASTLAGCTTQSGGLSDDYNQGDSGGNYISGDGTVVVVPTGNRGEAVAYAGTTDGGDDLSSDDLAGQVTVLNFWYAQCGPCRVEAPDLQKLHEQFGDDVAFVGVNVRDDAAGARSFAEKFGITYPSILDVGENDVVLAFAGDVPPNAVPTTLLIDKEGRVAARFSGAIASPSSVSDVLDDLLAE